MEEEFDDNEDSQEQGKKQRSDYIKPWQFKPGVSGNPGGRPKGSKSLKTFAREYLESLPDEDKLEYLAGMDKKTVWEMSEGKPKQDVDIDATITGPSVIRLDE